MVHSSTLDQMSCAFWLVIASQQLLVLMITPMQKTANTQRKQVPLQIYPLILLVQMTTMLKPVMDPRDHSKEQRKATVS